MKKVIYLALLATIYSCSSNNNEDILKYTNDTTLGLSRVNLKTVAEKVSADKVLKEKKNIHNEQKLFLELVNKPKESGINVDKPLYIIVDPGKSNTDNEPNIKAYFEIDDKTKFQKSMSDITKTKVTIDKKDFIYVDGLLTGSIKGKEAILTKEPNNRYDREYTKYDEIDSITTVVPEKKPYFDEKYFTDFWNRKGPSNKVIKEQVNQSLAGNKDMSAWVNLSAVANYLSKGYIETLAVNKLIKDSGVGMEVTFDKGSAEMNTKTFFNSEMQKVVEKYYSKNKINYDLVKTIDVDKAQSFSIGYFSLEFMTYLIKEAGFESTINNYLSSSNKTLADITSIFTGDYAYVQNKIHPDSASYSSRSEAIILGIDAKKADGFKGFMEGPYGYDRKYIINGNKVIISDDSQLVYQFKSNKDAKNANLDKKSGVTSYSWTDGSEYNRDYDNNKVGAKIVKATNEYKQENGNMISKTVFTVDKKDQNTLYYFIMND